MKRTKNRLALIVALAGVLVVLMIGTIYAEWSEDLKLPSDKGATSPTPTPSDNKPMLAFPTTAAEIANSLPKPEVTSKLGTRGLGGIADDEAMLAKMPKVGALVLFDYNSDMIKDESKPLLREYGKVLQSLLKDAVLIVAGHTDSIGSDRYNLELSNRRAEAIKKFLVAEFQIADRRLIIKPYGKSTPITSNETEDGRAQNRRVEFIRIQ
jgi:outer membrane protein OmpA-like peptidoglycan-associated protein